MPNDDLMKATFAKAKSISAGIGLEIKAGGSGGGSVDLTGTGDLDFTGLESSLQVAIPEDVIDEE